MDALIKRITSDFVDGMLKSGNNATRQIVALVRKFDTVEDKIIPSDRNIQLIDGVSIGIQQVALSGAFQSRVDKVLNSLPELRKETERAFIVQHGIITYDLIATLDYLQNQTYDYLYQALGDQAVINGVMTPTLNLLSDMLTGGYTIDQALRLAQVKVPSLFTEYAHTRVDTTLQIYVREQIRLMAQQKELRWFRYSGPVTPTPLGNQIRPFCLERVDGIYLDTEIASWANEDWEGKIPSTNQYSIFQNLGGFNCRHNLMPVAEKDVPQSSFQRARLQGLI